MIIGISSHYHDSAVAVIENSQVIFSAQEERYTRKKHDPAFPTLALKDAIRYCSINSENLEAVVFYEKPFIRFERIIENFLDNVPKGLKIYLHSVPIWISEKIFIKQIIRRKLKKLIPFSGNIPIYFSWHHLSHAASTFYTSDFPEAAVLTIDGIGERSSCSIYLAKAQKIKLLKEIKYPHSIGFLYSSFTYFLGFKVNSGEYKLMGLAPYGEALSKEVMGYKKKIYSHLITSYDDGSIKLNMDYFRFQTTLKMINESEWEKLFSLKSRKENEPILQVHKNLAFAIQSVLEEIVLKLIYHTKEITGMNNLCLAGGVSLNCVLNTKIKQSGLFDQIHIQAAAGDSGGAIGAALVLDHFKDSEKSLTNSRSAMPTPYLGPSYSDSEIEQTIEKYNARFKKINNTSELNTQIASNLSLGKIVAWYQGRMEFGPRALGNRSILADARYSDMKMKLNASIKYRELFRPFAPIVLEDDLKLVFENGFYSPNMLYVDFVNDYFKLPAITHVDRSARLQSVSESQNKKIYGLLKAYKSLTGIPLLVNTSFNVRGEPIVNTPQDAYLCFMNSGIDILVMNNYVFFKEHQKQISSSIKQTFKPD